MSRINELGGSGRLLNGKAPEGTKRNIEGYGRITCDTVYLLENGLPKGYELVKGAKNILFDERRAEIVQATKGRKIAMSSGGGPANVLDNVAYLEQGYHEPDEQFAVLKTALPHGDPHTEWITEQILEGHAPGFRVDPEYFVGKHFISDVMQPLRGDRTILMTPPAYLPTAGPSSEQFQEDVDTYLASFAGKEWPDSLKRILNRIKAIKANNGKGKSRLNPSTTMLEQLPEHGALVDEAIETVDTSYFNTGEAKVWLNNKIPHRKPYDNLWDLAIQVQDQGGNEVVITDGANGLLKVTKEGKGIFAPANKKLANGQGPFTLATGDAVVAGDWEADRLGLSDEEATLFASIMAAYITTRPDARSGRPTLAEALSVLYNSPLVEPLVVFDVHAIQPSDKKALSQHFAYAS